MKKLYFLTTIIIFLFLLSACGSDITTELTYNNENYQLTHNQDNTFTFKSESNTLVITKVDNNSFTVTDYQTTYEVEVFNDDYTVRFPNGSYNTNISEFDRNAKEVKLIIQNFNFGDSAANINGGQILIGLFLSVVGVLVIKFPKFHWFIDEGWKFKNVEPSELYIDFTIIFGYVLVIAGAIYILIGLF